MILYAGGRQLEAKTIAESLLATPACEDAGTPRKLRKAAEASAEAASPSVEPTTSLQPKC